MSNSYKIHDNLLILKSKNQKTDKSNDTEIVKLADELQAAPDKRKKLNEFAVKNGWNRLYADEVNAICND